MKESLVRRRLQHTPALTRQVLRLVAQLIEDTGEGYIGFAVAVLLLSVGPKLRHILQWFMKWVHKLAPILATISKFGLEIVEKVVDVLAHMIDKIIRFFGGRKHALSKITDIFDDVVQEMIHIDNDIIAAPHTCIAFADMHWYNLIALVFRLSTSPILCPLTRAAYPSFFLYGVCRLTIGWLHYDADPNGNNCKIPVETIVCVLWFCGNLWKSVCTAAAVVTLLGVYRKSVGAAFHVIWHILLYIILFWQDIDDFISARTQH